MHHILIREKSPPFFSAEAIWELISTRDCHIKEERETKYG
jgi:hypothetical protein